MRLIDLQWDDNKDKAHVKYSKMFEETHLVTQLDMLQDCIFALRERYDELLNNFSGTGLEVKPKDK